MSVIEALLIEDTSISKTMTMFPDKSCTYWDVSIREKTGVYWYYLLLMGAFYLYVTKQTPDASTCIVLAILSAGEFIGWRCGK